MDLWWGMKLIRCCVEFAGNDCSWIVVDWACLFILVAPILNDRACLVILAAVFLIRFHFDFDLELFFFFK